VNEDFYLDLFLPGLEGAILGSVLDLVNAEAANFSYLMSKLLNKVKHLIGRSENSDTVVYK
jgi:hypothetical protein